VKFTELPASQSQLDHIRTLEAPGSLWQKEAAAFLARAAQPAASTDDLMQLLHEAQRLSRIAAAGLAANAQFRQQADAYKLPMWKDYGTPPASSDLQESLAKKLYNVDPKKDRVALLRLGDGAREIGRWLADKCLADGIGFIAEFSDPDFSAFLLNNADEAGVKALAAAYVAQMQPVSKIIACRPGLPEKQVALAQPAKAQLYARGTKPFGDRVTSGDLFYTLTEIPTKRDAQVDGIPYNDYVTLFFEMCDQPWKEVGKAQQELIKEFNAASTVRITNDDGTDISMSLVDDDGGHFTFCNSLIAKNVPGSEIFSAPRRGSVEGKVVAKGRFSHSPGKIIENLTMEFEKGRLVRYSADSGLEHFEEEIGVDDGARFVGELGIGTNPHLDKHVTNGLFVEKIGGSFHLALGQAYTYTEYGGVPVKVDNGNKSALHWDITTMLKGKNGKIFLDGRQIMDNGQWLDAKYDVLNRGWEALPRDRRPDYWKDYHARKKAAGRKP
jgi:aminopeptidase